MDRRLSGAWVEKNEWLIAALLIALGTALRIIMLGDLPFGLNQDEASTGYEAWSLLNFGVDRNGYSWPVLLKSWGSGQNALYSYLAMPFIALFGLNTLTLRLVSALAGVATLPVFWLLAREIRGRAFGLTALFVLAVNPWHIMISRWALESNLLPFFLILGIYLLVLTRRRPAAVIPAAASFALALSAYGTAFLFLSLYLIFGLLWLLRYNAARAKFVLPALAVFVVLALPVAVCHLNNLLGGQDLRFFGLSLPRLTANRMAATTVFGGGSMTDNYRGFLSLLWKQSDALTFNALPYFGLFYFFGLPFIAVGFVSSVANFRDRVNELPLIFAVAISLLCAFFISPNINRMNMAWLPLIYFEAVGIHMLLRRLRKFAAVPLFFMLISLALFVNSYIGAFRASPHFYPGLESAIKYVEAREPESVFITDYVNQPYIYVLFYNQIPPGDYLETVNYVNPGGAFEHVLSFGKYKFGNASDADARYMILHNSECEGYVVEETFGAYSVCVPQE